MNPEQQQAPNVPPMPQNVPPRQPVPPQQPYTAPQPAMPQQPYATPQPAATAPASQKKGIKLPIILMVWPAATLVLVIVLTIIVNALSGGSSDGLFGDTGPLKTITNVLTFLVGGLAVFLGPISFIVGLVLLIVRKTKA